MTEPNTLEINSRANETFGETYGRLETLRLVSRLAHRRVERP
jgi:hypothetical protein